MTNLIHLHHASIIVADTQRSLDFYCGVLGLKTDDSRPDLGYPGAWLQLGSQQIHLLQVPDPDLGRQPPEHGGRDRHIAIGVRDISAVADALDAAAVSYTRSRSGRAALFCRDPDGNVLEFIEQA